MTTKSGKVIMASSVFAGFTLVSGNPAAKVK